MAPRRAPRACSWRAQAAAPAACAAARRARSGPRSGPACPAAPRAGAWPACPCTCGAAMAAGQQSGEESSIMGALAVASEETLLKHLLSRVIPYMSKVTNSCTSHPAVSICGSYHIASRDSVLQARSIMPDKSACQAQAHAEAERVVRVQRSARHPKGGAAVPDARRHAPGRGVPHTYTTQQLPGLEQRHQHTEGLPCHVCCCMSGPACACAGRR